MDYRFHALKLVYQVLITLVMTPGLLMNIPSLLISRKFCGLIEDKQMHNTYSFMVGMIINPLIYFLIALLITIIFKLSFLYFIIALFAAGIFGIAGEKWRQYIKIPFLHFQYITGKKKKFFQQCRKDYEELKKAVYQLIDKSFLN